MSRVEAGAFQQAQLGEALARARAAGGYAGNLLRSRLLSVGLYTLEAGGVDDQAPHAEDEVYVTIRRRARFRVEEQDHPVAPGTMLFVPARAAHAFHAIEEELVLVVFWAPPEGEA
ncbi:MAG TPA: cupin domain-containing protein [Candidatus Limnocylindrales bacterium]|nr:cupin domain-containing protein [Candidatus Limnocylindrales bacterium]